MKDYKIKVTSISDKWPVCAYKLFVSVGAEDISMQHFSYVLETLRAWFGEAEYFWSSNGCMSFLCDRKQSNL